MKKIICILSFFFLTRISFSQCPQPGLKIQRATCESPTNLKTDAITCSSLIVSWQGNKNQSYIARTVTHDPRTGNISETEASNYSCDDGGHCVAVIPIQEGTSGSWKVQGACTQSEAVFYGNEVNGQSVITPMCSLADTSGQRNLKIFPNPSNGEIVVDYNKPVTSNTQFAIINSDGQQNLLLDGNVLKRVGINGYVIDLHNLVSGVYFLKVTNGQEVNTAKFIMMKD